MDKVKQFLAVLKQRHFWVLCGVILILSFVSWSSGKSFFSAEFTKQKGTISSKFSALQSISNTPNHPNDTFTTEATKIADELKQKTYAAWEQVYNAQKSELTWIEDPQMIGEILPMAEGETAEAVTPQEKRLLDKFFNFFSANYVPQLFSPKVINLVRPVTVTVAEGQEPRNEGVIVWDQTQRTAIQQRYNWDKVPTSKAIRLAQEDYWIYRSVLQTINSANAGAQATHEAAVKRILTLEIAQQALASVMTAKAEMPHVTSEMIVNETTEAPKIPTAASPDEELDANRYATAVVTATAEEGAEGGGGAGGGSGQYKLVPVRMELLVRESKVPDLLAACANAKLPIEVRRCTLRQAAADKAAPAANAAAPAGAAAATAAGAAAGVADDGDVVIDIYGVIYLYNPPSKTALNMTEETPAEGEAPVEEGV